MDVWKCPQAYDGLCIVMFVVLIALQDVAVDQLILTIVEIINLYTTLFGRYDPVFKYTCSLLDCFLVSQLPHGC